MKNKKPLTIGEKLLLLYELRRTNQARVSSQVGLRQQDLSKVETGIRRLTLQEALRVARVLDVPMDWLCDDDATLPVPSRPGEETKLLEIARAMPYEIARARLCAVDEVGLDERPAPRRGGKRTGLSGWNDKKNA